MVTPQSSSGGGAWRRRGKGVEVGAGGGGHLVREAPVAAHGEGADHTGKHLHLAFDIFPIVQNVQIVDPGGQVADGDVLAVVGVAVGIAQAVRARVPALAERPRP